MRANCGYLRLILGLVIVLGLAGCATKPAEAPPEPTPAPAAVEKPAEQSPAPPAVVETPGAENSSIAAATKGFSPTSARGSKTLELRLAVGSKASVKAWQVDVLDAGAAVKKTWKGEGTTVPETLAWDGLDPAGLPLPDGSYLARLSVDYGGAFKPALVESQAFGLVTSPPRGLVSASPATVAPATLGAANPVTFSLEPAEQPAFITRWKLSLTDKAGAELASWEAGWPNRSAAWDGSLAGGGRIAPESELLLKAEVVDEYGNLGSFGGAFTVSDRPAPREASTIAAPRPTFAPGSPGSPGSLRFDFAIGHPASVKAWSLDLVDEGGGVTASEKGAGLPAALEWDGKTSQGSEAPEGSYKARLAIDYGLEFRPTTIESASFALSLSAPRVTLSLSAGVFSPDGDGQNDQVTITMAGSSKYAKIKTWTLEVKDPAGRPFASWKGDWPAAPLEWQGRGVGGQLVESASEYSVDLRLRDEFGRTSEAKTSLVTGILVDKTQAGYRIRVPSITFQSFTADYRDVPAGLAAQNAATLDWVAAALARFPDYRIRVQGHAVMIHWFDAAKGEIEQQEVLIPLSLERAKAISLALEERGINGGLLTPVGLGADDPVVPNSDLGNRWKNRRVEFYLAK